MIVDCFRHTQRGNTMKKAFESFIKEKAKAYQTEAYKGERILSSWLNEEAQKNFMQELRERSNFLQSINWLTVTELNGKSLFGALDGTTTGRKQDERHRSLLIYRNEYQTQETDSGVFVPWLLIDELSSLQEDFEKNYTALTDTQFILDMLQIGWCGESVAQDTQAADLSDVNIGWLAQLKQKKPAHVISNGKKTGKIELFSDDADYKNLNELATALRQKLPEHYQNRNDLVFFVGSELAAKEGAIYVSPAQNQQPGKDTSLNSHYLANYYGGMPAIIPPCFPSKGAVVTTFRNLSIYTQKNSIYRAIYDDGDKLGVINSYRRNDGYVIEKMDLMAAIEHKNVVFGGK
ncbi:phage major capsid protein, P2 family [Aggregatibacter actinomycetemcomitans]|uniref:phage major capsid protein, P2 family n=1 Tax=Aggregatibacter actinomycetemcomitans TaxID=714 RepID=UPI001F11D16B|nr:phage major capsid protein, P2 family [Aggregatibacter actinomycetemcomitans]